MNGYGRQVRLNVISRGSGPPIVFLHGMGASAATWDAVGEALSDRYLTVAVDLPGHGGSPCPDDPDRFTRDAALADVDELLATLAEPAILVGHSLGGGVAMQFAYQFPQMLERLILIGAGGVTKDVNIAMRFVSLPIGGEALALLRRECQVGAGN